MWKDEKQGLTFCHTKTKKKVLSIRVEDSMYKRICDYAGKHKMTVTEVVLQGLEKILNRPE